MTDTDSQEIETFDVELDRWCDDRRFEVPPSVLDELPDLACHALLQGLLAALETRFPGTATIHDDEQETDGRTSAPLMIPGTRLHISLHAIRKSVLNAIIGTGALWAVSGIPGPREVAATATASAAASIFDVLTRLSPAEAQIVWYVARTAHDRGFCGTGDIVDEFGASSRHRLEELRQNGILRGDEESGWSVTL